MNPVDWFFKGQMHELSVTENILEIVLRHAKSADANRVSDIYLVIGDLSSIIDDSVQFYWDMVSKDTIAEDSKLHFKRIQTALECKDCEQDYAPNGKDLACPDCGSVNLKILSGNEFYLEAINIE